VPPYILVINVNTKHHENPPGGSQLVPCGEPDIRTDTRDKCNSRSSCAFLINRLESSDNKILHFCFKEKQ